MDLAIVKVEGCADGSEYTITEDAQVTDSSNNFQEAEIYIEMVGDDSIKQEYFSPAEDEDPENKLIDHEDELVDHENELVDLENEYVVTDVVSLKQRAFGRKPGTKSQKRKNLSQENKTTKSRVPNKRKRKVKQNSSASKKKESMLNEPCKKEKVKKEEDNKNGTGRRKKKTPRKVAIKFSAIDEIKEQDESKVKLDGSYDPDTDTDAKSTDDYLCNVCGKEFSGKSQLNRHTKQCRLKKGKSEHACRTCGKILRTKNEFSNHYKVHVAGTFLCEKCGKSFNAPGHLKTHWQTVHENITYKCGVEGCSKVFSHPSNRTKHINSVHLNLRKYQCTDCPLAFKTTSSLKVHIYTRHTDDKQMSTHLCNICGKAFYTNAHRKQHELVHTDIRPFACTYENCGKQFRDRSNLSKHERVHENIKPYKCKDCGESFSRKVYLTTHQYKHTGVKMFQCTVCDKSFTQNGNLKSHMRLHTEDCPVYKCQKCDRIFNHKSNYTKHMVNHKNPDFRNVKRKRHGANQILMQTKVESDYELMEESLDYEGSVKEDIKELDEIYAQDAEQLSKSGSNTHSTIVVCRPENSVHKKPLLIIKHRIVPDTVNNAVQTEETLDTATETDEESTQVEAVESMVENQDATETVESESAETKIVESIDLSNMELISDGVTEIIQNIHVVTTDSQVVQEMENDVIVSENTILEPEQVPRQTVKVLVAGDDTAHEVEAEILKDFLEKCGKSVVTDVGIIPVVTEVNSQAEIIEQVETVEVPKSTSEAVSYGE